MLSSKLMKATHDYATYDRPIPAPYLRKTFVLDAVPDSALVTLTCTGFYRLWINSVEVDWLPIFRILIRCCFMILMMYILCFAREKTVSGCCLETEYPMQLVGLYGILIKLLSVLLLKWRCLLRRSAVRKRYALKLMKLFAAPLHPLYLMICEVASTTTRHWK